MQPIFRSVLVAALAAAPGVAIAQMVIEEPPILVEEVMAAPLVEAPMLAPIAGPIDAERARIIAMMNGIVVVEEVDTRLWGGDYEVEGTDAAGNELEIIIAADTGEVLYIDD